MPKDRDLGTSTLRRQLQRLGRDRGRAGPIAGELRAAIQGGSALGLSREEVASLVGISRQALHQWGSRPTSPPNPFELETTVLAVLTAGGPLSVPDLSELLEAEDVDVQTCVDTLVMETNLEQLVTPDGDKPGSDVYLAVTVRGLEILRWRHRQLELERPEAWVVYASLRRGEGAALENAGTMVQGPAPAKVIPRRTTRSMKSDELGISVHAADSRAAIEAAGGLWRRLRLAAELPAREMQVTAIAPPQS